MATNNKNNICWRKRTTCRSLIYRNCLKTASYWYYLGNGLWQRCAATMIHVLVNTYRKIFRFARRSFTSDKRYFDLFHLDTVDLDYLHIYINEEQIIICQFDWETKTLLSFDGLLESGSIKNRRKMFAVSINNNTWWKKKTKKQTNIASVLISN